MRESIVQIMRHVGEAPFLVHMFLEVQRETTSA
jgi:hypothetical protein